MSVVNGAAYAISSSGPSRMSSLSCATNRDSERRCAKRRDSPDERYNVDQPATEITNAPTVLQHRDSLPRSLRQERGFY